MGHDDFLLHAIETTQVLKGFSLAIAKIVTRSNPLPAKHP